MKKSQSQGARLMLSPATRMAGAHQRCGVEISKAKLFATEVAKSVALGCQTSFGAYDCVKDFDVGR